MPLNHSKTFWRFHLGYFAMGLVLFLIELAIALWLHDDFIRPHFGDYLVVFLVYAAVMTVGKCKPAYAALGVWIFACLVELLQAFNLPVLLGVQHSAALTTAVGTTFDWLDLLSYSLGCLTIVFIENRRRA